MDGLYLILSLFLLYVLCQIFIYIFICFLEFRIFRKSALRVTSIKIRSDSQVKTVKLLNC